MSDAPVTSAAPAAAPAVDPADEIAELQAKQAAREKARADAFRAEELVRARLIEKYETELGPIGQAFDIVDCREHGEGFIAIKLGPAVVHTRFVTTKQQHADAVDYTVSNVLYPDRAAYLAIAGKRPAVIVRVANALATLYGVKKGEDAGKF